MINKSDFTNIVGASSVTDDAEILKTFSEDHSYTVPMAPALVVKPETPDQIRDIVKMAGGKSIPLVPVSSGPPRFRGDTVPSVEGAVILDMSGMKKIMWVNRRNRIVLVEPGVTFAEVEEATRKEGMRCMIPLLPRSTKSVVGAFMEREPFTVPKYAWDMGDPVASSEMILGDGFLTRTGGAAGPRPTLEGQREIGGAHKLPFSPMFMDIKRMAQGTQGSYAFCTWMGLRCELLPEHEKVYFAGADEPGKLVDASYRFMYLRLIDEMYILNRTNFACMLGKDSAEIEGLLGKLPPWIMVLSISGCGELPRDEFDYKDADINDEADRLGIKLEDEIGGIEESGYRAKAVRRVSGDPYWKLRLRGDAREVFFLTSLSRAPEFIKASEDAARSCGFNPADIGTYIQMVIQGAACHLEFDLYAADADGTMRTFYQELSRKIQEMGGYYSRPYGDWADLVYPQAETFVECARGLKNIFDPNKIMNPEKLCFKEM